MTLDPDTCYRALRSRDSRFDGLFYVGVKTTGIYCRPVCPARVPARSRCDFFTRAVEAEHAGFRACFRCRPELAPGSAPVDSIPRLVRTAAARIESGYLNEASLDELASGLGVSARHLRRSFGSELGVTPVELAQTRRLAMAKQLLQDTKLPLAEVAFASGFASIRRFNAAFQERFRRPPSQLRRAHGGGEGADFISLRLDYRPPYDWDALLGFLARRAVPGVESVERNEYRRSLAVGERAGWIAVRPEPGRPALRARVSLGLAPKVMEVSARLRALFDLDARPDVVAEHLRRHPSLRARVAARPGLRVPGTADPVELAVRAVLGQQVSVAGATTLAGRLVERHGKALAGGPPGVERLFPSLEALAALTLADWRALGLPAARATALFGLVRALAGRAVDLTGASEPERALAALRAIPGIGDWTAQYVALRALRWPDAFPAGDLAVRRALRARTEREASARAARWRPWRAYAVMHLWNAVAEGE